MKNEGSLRNMVLMLGLSLMLSAAALAGAQPDRTLFDYTLDSGPATLTVTLSDSSVLVLSTSQSEFYVGTPNQGWWSTVVSNTNDNSNYAVGTDHTYPGVVNNFFTFDLSGFRGSVVGATLSMGRGLGNQAIWGDGPATLAYGLWDVSTDAATLNARVNNPNIPIFNDLATGIDFGTFDLPTSGNPNDILTLQLNANAVHAIQAGEGSFFSIGGTVTGPATPEPSSVALLATAILGLAGVLRRRLIG